MFSKIKSLFIKPKPYVSKYMHAWENYVHTCEECNKIISGPPACEACWGVHLENERRKDSDEFASWCRENVHRMSYHSMCNSQRYDIEEREWMASMTAHDLDIYPV